MGPRARSIEATGDDDDATGKSRLQDRAAVGRRRLLPAANLAAPGSPHYRCLCGDRPARRTPLPARPRTPARRPQRNGRSDASRGHARKKIKDGGHPSPYRCASNYPSRFGPIKQARGFSQFLCAASTRCARVGHSLHRQHLSRSPHRRKMSQPWRGRCRGLKQGRRRDKPSHAPPIHHRAGDVHPPP